jgi:hypothetical protein
MPVTPVPRRALIVSAQKELLDLLLPLRDEIVEVKSPKTGTPLPDSYQARAPSELTAVAVGEGRVCRFVIAAIR